MSRMDKYNIWLLVFVAFESLTRSSESTTRGIDYYFNTNVSRSYSAEFGCTSAGCSITKSFEIDGECTNPTMTLGFVETDYSATLIEYVSIYINDYYLGECDGLNEDCANNTLVNCSNFINFGLSSFVTAPTTSSVNYLDVKFDASPDVNVCPYNGSYYVWGKVLLYCGLSNYFNTSTSESFNAHFGCDSAGCSVTKSFDISGQCINPTMTLSFIETDYNEHNEYVKIYVNDDYLGQCDGLVDECNPSNTLVGCSNFINLDLSSYVTAPNAASLNSLNVTFAASSEVDGCPYGNTYYVWGQVSLNCDNDYNGTSDYIFSTSNNGYATNTQYLECGPANCNISKTWTIDGTCETPTLAVNVMDNEFIFNSTYESLDIYLRTLSKKSFVGSCDAYTLDSGGNLAGEWIGCSIDGKSSYDISDHINSFMLLLSYMVDEENEYYNWSDDSLFNQTLYNKSSVKDHYLSTQVVLGCGSSEEPTIAPTIAPTVAPQADNDAVIIDFTETEIFLTVYLCIYTTVVLSIFVVGCHVADQHPLYYTSYELEKEINKLLAEYRMVIEEYKKKLQYGFFKRKYWELKMANFGGESIDDIDAITDFDFYREDVEAVLKGIRDKIDALMKKHYLEMMDRVSFSERKDEQRRRVVTRKYEKQEKEKQKEKEKKEKKKANVEMELQIAVNSVNELKEEETKCDESSDVAPESDKNESNLNGIKLTIGSISPDAREYNDNSHGKALKTMEHENKGQDGETYNVINDTNDTNDTKDNNDSNDNSSNNINGNNSNNIVEQPPTSVNELKEEESSDVVMSTGVTDENKNNLNTMSSDARESNDNNNINDYPGETVKTMEHEKKSRDGQEYNIVFNDTKDSKDDDNSNDSGHDNNVDRLKKFIAKKMKPKSGFAKVLHSMKILWSLKGLLVAVASHFFDVATDIALIIEWYFLWKNNVLSDYDIDMTAFFGCAVATTLYYRVISTWRIWTFTGNKLDAFLQFTLDLYIIKLVYINLVKMKRYEKLNVITLHRGIEGSHESAFQAVLTLTFLIKTDFAFAEEISVLSFILSCYSLISRYVELDHPNLEPKARKLIKYHNFKCRKGDYRFSFGINWWYVYHWLFRIIEIGSCIVAISLIWHGLGGEYVLIFFMTLLVYIVEGYRTQRRKMNAAASIPTDWFRAFLVSSLTHPFRSITSFKQFWFPFAAFWLWRFTMFGSILYYHLYEESIYLTLEMIYIIAAVYVAMIMKIYVSHPYNIVVNEAIQQGCKTETLDVIQFLFDNNTDNILFYYYLTMNDQNSYSCKNENVIEEALKRQPLAIVKRVARWCTCGKIMSNKMDMDFKTPNDVNKVIIEGLIVSNYNDYHIYTICRKWFNVSNLNSQTLNDMLDIKPILGSFNDEDIGAASHNHSRYDNVMYDNYLDNDEIVESFNGPQNVQYWSIYEACWELNVKYVKSILSKGLFNDINKQQSQNGRTVLHCVMAGIKEKKFKTIEECNESGATEIINLLKENGIDETIARGVYSPLLQRPFCKLHKYITAKDDLKNDELYDQLMQLNSVGHEDKPSVEENTRVILDSVDT